ncbi:MAG: hypothetical protein AAF889_02865 [Cyanobacteria bacterium P01_D01_bin.73]
MGGVRKFFSRGRSSSKHPVALRFLALFLGGILAIASYGTVVATAQIPGQSTAIAACPELSGLSSYDDWVNFRDRQVALALSLESQREKLEGVLQGMALEGGTGEPSGANFEAQQQSLTSQIARVKEEIQTVSKELQKQRSEETRRSQQAGADDLALLEEPLSSGLAFRLEELKGQERDLDGRQRQLIVNKTIYDARSQELSVIKGQILQAERCKVETDKQVRATLRQDAYRLWASLGFCLLVGLTIAAFFVTLHRSGDGAAEILAGNQGIQIMTLFLIVIAIILFGLLGILESKELSALLGGITGYILGRVSQENVRGLISSGNRIRALLPGSRPDQSAD